MKKILVTGGAGYIGSCVNAWLNLQGKQTLVLDNLIYGHKEALDYRIYPKKLDFAMGGGRSLDLNLSSQSIAESKFRDSKLAESKSPESKLAESKLAESKLTKSKSTESKFRDSKLAESSSNPTSQSSKTTFIHANLSDTNALERLFSDYEIEAVLHFAAFAYVGESVKNPAKYYINNVANTLNLLESMRKANVKKLIFSSTCATYGNPLHLPITESHPQNPINPYGYSKLMIEQILRDYDKAYGLKSVILRYFNACGASLYFDIGESHNPETHLIPLVLQSALKQGQRLSVFGVDYKTRDGSCIRDYIHIDDLADAHILALNYLQNSGESEVFNLGNGDGFSVLEVLHTASEITHTEIPHNICPRRAGDPAILIGDSTKAQKILGWNPKHCDLATILKSALKWHKNARY